MGWSEERIAQLKSLWLEGYSASQVARIMGAGDTRSAVCGEVHRLVKKGELQPRDPHRTRPSHNVAVKIKALPAPVKLLLPPPPPPVEEDPIMLADGKHPTVLTINDRMCHWPIGDPAESDFHYCGHKPMRKSSYCEAHCRKMYQPPPARRGYEHRSR